MSKKFHEGGLIRSSEAVLSRLPLHGEIVFPSDTVERLALRQRQIVEQAVLGSTVTVTANAAPAMPFTMAKLEEAMSKIAGFPPAPFFGSSVRFPADHALRFTHEGQDYALAHPDFWAKVKGSLPASNTPPNFGAIEIVDLDIEYRERERERVFAAIKAALPDVVP